MQKHTIVFYRCYQHRTLPPHLTITVTSESLSLAYGKARSVFLRKYGEEMYSFYKPIYN